VTDDDFESFGQHLAACAETLGVDLTPARIEGYFVALRDLPIEPVLRAIEIATATSRFFPKPIELRELAGAGLPDAGLVEQHLRAYLLRGGFPGPFLKLVLDRLGGARAAGEMTTAQRLAALRGIVPALLPLALARGLAVPTQALGIDQRPAPEPERIPHEQSARVLRLVGYEK
jgi:hypothetical protein